MKVEEEIKKNRLALTIPIHEIESEAIDQIKNCLEIPYLEKLAVMPDCHTGYDLPIGGVALIKNFIWPGAVGFDIGCGMCHINTKMTEKDLKLENNNRKNKLYKKILEEIPVGFNLRKKPVNTIIEDFSNYSEDKELKRKVSEKQYKQIGTLGGGNHFIELGVNSKEEIGITIHSGSRKSGWLIGEFYMNLAKVSGSKFGKIGMFQINSEYGEKYYNDMLWAQNYALENRQNMMIKILELLGLNTNLIYSSMINENHNHAVVNGNYILHRKGATPAERNQIGIIPANQKEGVWVTRGLGNEKYLSSASHGAGRKMSRKKAKENLKLKDFSKSMKGIVGRKDKSVLDESPDAYKPIEYVLENQKDLVEIIDHFKPIIVVKG